MAKLPAAAKNIYSTQPIPAPKPKVKMSGPTPGMKGMKMPKPAGRKK